MVIIELGNGDDEGGAGDKHSGDAQEAVMEGGR